MEAIVETVQILIMAAVMFFSGYCVGAVRGALRERERRDKELDERVSERLQKLADMEREHWETEIDA
jgi:hypothetical protein